MSIFMNILKSLFYYIHNYYINFTNIKVKVSHRCCIKPGTKFGKYIKIGDGTYFTGLIGSYSYIASNCRINAKIGKFCSIASGVKTVEGFHPTNLISTSPALYSIGKQCGYSFVDKMLVDDCIYADQDHKIACVIGNDVWIGEDVLIKGGVTIGDGTIIAMGSVVANDVPPYSIYGGIPAKEIRKRFNDDEISKLLKIEWWNKSDSWLREHHSLFMAPDSFFNSL